MKQHSLLPPKPTINNNIFLSSSFLDRRCRYRLLHHKEQRIDSARLPVAKTGTERKITTPRYTNNEYLSTINTHRPQVNPAKLPKIIAERK